MIDRDAVFERTARGRALLGALEAESEVLATENREIEDRLRAEERDLTARRAGMDPAAFRAEADAFDARVQEIRARQDAKTREVLARQDALSDTFWEEALPILADILAERGAAVLLERGAVFLSSDAADITRETVRRIDAATAPPPAPGTGPDPAPAEGAGPPGDPAPTPPD